MTGKPVLAASASENVLFPDPASPVTMTRRPTRARAASLINASVQQVPNDIAQPAIRDAPRPDIGDDRSWGTFEAAGGVPRIRGAFVRSSDRRGALWTSV